MIAYIENELKYNNNSTIEYSLSLWNTPRVKVFVGLSTKPKYLGKYTFLDKNKKDTIFGAACRFNSIEQVIEYIKSDIKSQINNGETPSKLIIDGNISSPFIKMY